MEYYVYVTNDCNLNCEYCSVMLKKNQSNLPMTISYPLEMLKKFVDHSQDKYQEKTASIYFFGGEPTLNYSIINDLISLFKGETKYRVEFILHTNGILLDSIPNHILENIDLIFLSLNYEKLIVNNHISNYYSSIINSINKIKLKKNTPVIGRLTISEKTSLYSECCIAVNSFDYIYWQLDNQKTLNDLSKYKENYKMELSLLFNYWLSFLRKGVVLRFIPFLSVINKIINDVPKPTHFYCGYGEDIIYIQTDGSCYACCDEVESKIHYIGSLETGMSFNNMEISNTLCLNCEYLKLCGGRCGRMHKDFDNKRINDFCDMNIFMFNLIQDSIHEIRDLINKNESILHAINDSVMDYTELLP